MFQLEEQCDVSYWKEDAPVTTEALVEGVKVMMVVVVFFADVCGGDVGAWQSHHLEFFRGKMLSCVCLQTRWIRL